MLDKGIPREGCEIFCNDKKIGYVTSGTPQSQSLSNGHTMASPDVL